MGSMGTVGDALDNAVAESFFASLQCELLDRHSWPTRAGLARAMFAWIEGFYNPTRRHSTLGYLSPVDYETTAWHDPHTNPVRDPGSTPACWDAMNDLLEAVGRGEGEYDAADGHSSCAGARRSVDTTSASPPARPYRFEEIGTRDADEHIAAATRRSAS